jgi:hypothetical protein
MQKNDADYQVEEQFDNVKELNENQEKLSKLSKVELEVLESIQNWLITYRKYRDYDFTEEFKVTKILPLIKFVEYKEFEFVDNAIIQHLREPVEMTDLKGNVVKKLTELKYRTRYQDFELDNYTRGINLQKEQLLYIRAQVALLTNTAKSIIGKLSDVDSNNSKLISSLYFLG